MRCGGCVKLLGVSPSGYYGWLPRPPSPHQLEDWALTDWIVEAHRRSRDTYGAPRIHAELRAAGVRVGRKRVARLMRAAGIEGVHRRKKHRTTRRDPNTAPAPDLVNRDFTVSGPDRLWVAENFNYPRRVSVWTAAGELARTFYGPTEYGGGGVLDPGSYSGRHHFTAVGRKVRSRRKNTRTGTPELKRPSLGPIATATDCPNRTKCN